MARFFLSRDAMDLASGVIPITGDDAHHIAFSLRMAVGDALTVCDMQKTEYACTITDIKPDLVLLRIDEVRGNSTELPLEICLYQSLPKGDKMDTIVQKAVELVHAVTTGHDFSQPVSHRIASTGSIDIVFIYFTAIL